MSKRLIAVLIFLSLGMSSLQAQFTCDLETVDAYLEAASDFIIDQRDYTSGMAAYRCALELEPDNAEVYSRMGVLYYFSADYANAIENYTAALELEPTRIYDLYSRARSYYEIGLFAEALADVNALLLLDNRFENMYLLRAWIYINLDEEGTRHQDFLTWMTMTERLRLDLELAETADYENLPIEARQNYYLSFTAEAGTSFSAAAASDDEVDPLLVLLAPDGTALASDDDSGANLNAVIARYELPATGLYTLVLGQAGGYGTGAVELNVIVGNTLISTSGSTTADISRDFAQYNLFIGDLAEVFTTGGDRLNLRAEPTIEAEILDRLEYGELVTLIEGPRKEGGYLWWRVRNAEGLEGWAVERVETEQTLQLALLQGESAIVVTMDERLNVRENPARDAELLFQLRDGEVLTLLDEAPVIEGGLRWWHIETADGRQGWAVDRIDVERTLAPAREFPNR